MEPLKKHGDPLEEEIDERPSAAIDEVRQNQPGSKGRRDEDEQPIVRSASQKPNANQPDDDATMPPEGAGGGRRSNM